MADGIYDAALKSYSGTCGEDIDHDTDVVFEDDEIVQWVCRNCGGEGWDDKQERSDADRG
jgi:hypothetical protein